MSWPSVKPSNASSSRVNGSPPAPKPPQPDGSAQAADAALALLFDVNDKQRHGDVDQEYIEQAVDKLVPSAAALRKVQAVLQNERRIAELRPKVFAAAAAVGVAALGTIAGAGWLRLRAAPSVDGIVTLDGQPVGDVDVRFHPTTEGASAPLLFKTGKTGELHVARIPDGSYAITLCREGDSAPTIPPAYGDPTATPFRVSIRERIPALQLLVRTAPPGP